VLRTPSEVNIFRLAFQHISLLESNANIDLIDTTNMSLVTGENRSSKPCYKYGTLAGFIHRPLSMHTYNDFSIVPLTINFPDCRTFNI